MSMVCNKTEVMLLTKDDRVLYWEMWLDNEIYTELMRDERIFDSVSTVETFVECIGKAFKDRCMDYEGADFIKQYCDEFSEDRKYKELKNMVKKNAQNPFSLKNFKKAVLVSNNEERGGRMYYWNLYDFENGSFKSGMRKAKPGSNFHSDRDDCEPKSKDFMESLMKSMGGNQNKYPTEWRAVPKYWKKSLDKIKPFIIGPEALEFAEKTFVFDHSYALFDENGTYITARSHDHLTEVKHSKWLYWDEENPIVKKVLEAGGFVRNSINGKTNYYVMANDEVENATWVGETNSPADVRDLLIQINNKGKGLRIVKTDDLVAAINKNRTE